MAEATKEELRAELGAASVELKQLQSRIDIDASTIAQLTGRAQAAERDHEAAEVELTQKRRRLREYESECAALHAELDLVTGHKESLRGGCSRPHETCTRWRA